MINNKSNTQILKELNWVVHGHIEAKKALINLVAKQQMFHHQLFIQECHTNELLELSNLLLIGKSGTGKTAMIKALAKVAGFPLVCLDASHLNPSGSAKENIKVADIPDRIRQNAEYLMRDEPHNYHSLEGTIARTIVFIDEADKLVGSGTYSYWMKEVQTNFLKLLEESPCSYIFAGAFTELFKQRSSNKQTIGFFNEKNQTKSIQKEINEEDITEYGLMPELVGRFTQIVSLEDLSTADYIHIYNNQIWPQKEKELKLFNINPIPLSDEKLEEMALQSYKSNLGVRYFKRALDKEFENLFFNYEDKEINIPNEKITDVFVSLITGE